MSSAKSQLAITLSPGMMIFDKTPPHPQPVILNASLWHVDENSPIGDLNPPPPMALDWTNWRNAAIQNRYWQSQVRLARHHQQFFSCEYLLDGLVEAKKTCLYCRSLVPSRVACTQCGAAL